MGGRGLYGSGSGYGQAAGTCERGDGPPGATKCGQFLHKVRNFSRILLHGVRCM